MMEPVTEAYVEYLHGRLRSKCVSLALAQTAIGGVIFLVGVVKPDVFDCILGVVVLGVAASNISEWHTLGQATERRK